jgi:hypothetical protein
MVDPNEVLKVYIVPGKPLYIEFPCSVQFALPGTKSDLEVVAGLKEKNNVTLWAHSMTDVTGITIKCNRQVISMDVIPDVKKHQRYIRVIGFGEKNKKRKLIASSIMTENAIIQNNKYRKLIYSSDQYRLKTTKLNNEFRSNSFKKNKGEK